VEDRAEFRALTQGVAGPNPRVGPGRQRPGEFLG